MRIPALALLLILGFVLGSAWAEDGGQTPGEPIKLTALTLRVRMVKADNPPASIDVGFRRGLYWRSAGSLGKVKVGEWTPPFDCNGFFKGQGASDFVVVEFPGCRNFEAEYELSQDGKPLKTITERGAMDFSVIVIPHWLTRSGGQSTVAEFAENFMSLTRFNQERAARFDKAFGAAPLPRRYAFEASYWGYVEPDLADQRVRVWGRQSSLDAVKAEMRILRHLGYNGFRGEEGFRIAEKAGVRDQFLKHITFNHAQEPWYRIACPFDPQLREKRTAMIESASARARALPGVQDIWIHWGDEIGCIAKADHFTTCAVCAKEFQGYLSSQGLQPAAFGRKTWEEVIPFADWDKEKPTAGSWACETPEAARNLYYSMRFMNVTTAQFYEPAAKALKEVGIHVAPLRGCTPLGDGHSLDYFEFFDASPSTSIMWETSTRDARIWQWDSYLADITRAISRRNGVPVHVYIKPHRGAPAQRLLACVARGVKSFCWYNYGPPYAHGDEFTGPAREPLMMEVAGAARLLAAAEEITADGELLPEKPAVALVYPMTSFNLRRGIGHMNHFQDAKWVWLALRHDQAPVAILSETMIEEGALEGRRVLYVVGGHMRAKAAEAVRDWVRKGGTLWTDIEGLARDEGDQMQAAAVELTGQKWPAVELWGADPGYRATILSPFGGLQKGQEYAAPPSAGIKGGESMGLAADTTIHSAIGRHRLDAAGATTLATFADGGPALIRRNVGAGQVFVAGTFAGLAYSEKVRRADFDMTADFDAAQRRLITCALPADRALLRAPVASIPTVEAQLIVKDRNAALLLMNWTFHAGDAPAPPGPRPAYRKDQVTLHNVSVELHGLAAVEHVKSLRGHRAVLRQRQGVPTVTVDTLEAGDILELSGVQRAE